MFYGLLHALRRSGIKTSGLVAGHPILEGDVDVHSFAPSAAPLPMRLYRARHAARALLSALRPDIVASHFALYTLPWLDLIGDRPFVVHFHGPWALEGAVERGRPGALCAKRVVERLVYQRASHFVVLSDAFRRVLHNSYSVPIDRISIVPGGVDVDYFNVPPSPREARTRLQWPTDRPIVLCVRRLAHRMGLENLVDAFAHVTLLHPDVLLLIAGTGPLANALQERIDDLALTEHVRLLGFLPDEDLPYAYRAADVSIVPTVALEGFGLITIESLSAGTPVLVTPVGGLPETVLGLDENLVLPGAEVSDLVEGLRQALSSPDSLPSASACTSHARQNFSWDAVARQTRDVYAAVCSPAPV